MQVLNDLSKKSLIRPSVEQAVARLLLGMNWDSHIAIWTLSALDLCAQDHDLRECADSLNILFQSAA